MKNTPLNPETVGKGWYPLVNPLIEQCNKEGIEIAQIKEKFGGLRFYINGPASDELEESIDKAERASLTICESCGNPGKRIYPTAGRTFTSCQDCLEKEEE